MSTHQAHVRWSRAASESFTDLRYSRAHEWKFDGGVSVPASSAVSSVPLPYSKAENVDPEEAFVAAISSCHLLTFLYVAAKAKFVVDSYEDVAVGHMSKNESGRLAVTKVELKPNIVFAGARAPNKEELEHLHHLAHEECYIANSVRCEIVVGGHAEHRS